MKALVFGATGYTGQHVVAALALRGYSVVAHLRPESSAGTSESKFASLGVSWVRASWDAPSLGRLISTAQPELVFGLIGTTRKRAAQEGLVAEDIYERVDRALTSLAIDAVRAEAPSARFVYLSSVGVTPESSNPYLRARARVEAQLQASGLKFTIARPSFITGPDRPESRPLERWAAKLSDGALGVAATLGARGFRDKFGAMTGAELGAALVEAATRAACEGAILGVSDLKRLAAESERGAPRPERVA
jgi:uncharacterized protein YbjT (DUF2867 family)